MNVLSSLLGILIASVAFWGTAENLDSTSTSQAHAQAKLAPAAGDIEDPNIQVIGRVVDAMGAPVSGVMVVVRPFGEYLQFLAASHVNGQDPTMTDATGQFILPEMPPGNYSVVALHGNHPPGLAELIVTETSGPDRTSVEIVLNRADELISA